MPPSKVKVEARLSKSLESRVRVPVILILLTSASILLLKSLLADTMSFSIDEVVANVVEAAKETVSVALVPPVIFIAVEVAFSNRLSCALLSPEASTSFVALLTVMVLIVPSPTFKSV